MSCVAKVGTEGKKKNKLKVNSAQRGLAFAEQRISHGNGTPFL